MTDLPQAIAQSHSKRANIRHRPWVRVCHWIVTLSFFALTFSGAEILMVHPRLYWGDAGNDLTPALFELPISRNYQHGGWQKPEPFFKTASAPVSASRTYDIFNKNGWGRSLHFLSAWLLVITGLVYLIAGIVTGHFKQRLWPHTSEFSASVIRKDFIRHLGKMPVSADGERYGPLQKYTYMTVIFLLFPLTVMTGLAMSPAITAAYPFLLKMFAGAQSARTIHFFAAVVLLLFLVVHVVMVIRSGFRQQIQAITWGK